MEIFKYTFESNGQLNKTVTFKFYKVSFSSCSTNCFDQLTTKSQEIISILTQKVKFQLLTYFSLQTIVETTETFLNEDYAPSNLSNIPLDPVEHELPETLLPLVSKYSDDHKNKTYTKSPLDKSLNKDAYNVTNKMLEDVSESVLDETDVPASDVVDTLPLAGPNVMNVILVAAECAPWSKTGKSCFYTSTH